MAIVTMIPRSIRPSSAQGGNAKSGTFVIWYIEMD